MRIDQLGILKAPDIKQIATYAPSHKIVGKSDSRSDNKDQSDPQNNNVCDIGSEGIVLQKGPSIQV